jgi:hypothetical protein
METAQPFLMDGEITSTVATPSTEISLETETPALEVASKPAKTTRKKRSSRAKSQVATSNETSSETETPAAEVVSKPAKTTRKKRSSAAKSQVKTQKVETEQETVPKKRQSTKKRQTRKKTQDNVEKETDKNQDDLSSASAVMGVVDESQTEPASVETTAGQKKRRVGQRKPKRDPVG